MATTTRWGLGYPTLSDAADVPAWLQGLAEDLDDHAKDDQGALGTRPATGNRGSYFHATDTGQLFRDNGTTWDEIPLGSGVAAGDYKHSLQATSHGARGDGLFAWLLCDGSEVAAGYTALISLLTGAGSPFGTGPNARPRVPDLRGRTVVHPDGTAGRMASNDALGATGGAETHTLTAAQMPTHAHAVSDPGHAHGVYDPGHAHGMPQYPHYNGGFQPGYYFNFEAAGGVHYHSLQAGTYAATTGIGIYGNTTGISIQNAGSGQAHPNMPPYAVAGHWFLKT